MKNKNIKKTIYLITTGIAIGIIIMQLIFLARINKIESYNVLYKIRITNDYINVRTQPVRGSDKIYEAIKGEKYNVIETYSDENYNWYKIIFSDRRTGWVASSNTNAWVEEIK